MIDEIIEKSKQFHFDAYPRCFLPIDAFHFDEKSTYQTLGIILILSKWRWKHKQTLVYDLWNQSMVIIFGNIKIATNNKKRIAVLWHYDLYEETIKIILYYIFSKYMCQIIRMFTCQKILLIDEKKLTSKNK